MNIFTYGLSRRHIIDLLADIGIRSKRYYICTDNLRSGHVMAGKFEIYRDKKGELRFQIKASNRELILASEGYKSIASCRNGIASVQKNGPNPERYLAKVARNGKHHFVLKAGNHQVIGTSQLYDSERSMMGGMKSVQENVATAKITDLSKA